MKPSLKAFFEELYKIAYDQSAPPSLYHTNTSQFAFPTEGKHQNWEEKRLLKKNPPRSQSPSMYRSSEPRGPGISTNPQWPVI